MNRILLNKKNIIVIIIIIICLFLIYKYNQINDIEHFTTNITENEALRNISSLYNTQEMRLSNLTITNDITSRNVTSNNINTNNITSSNINTNNIITGNTNINGNLTISGSIMINNNKIASDSNNNLLITDTSNNTYLFKDGMIRTNNTANDSIIAILLDAEGKSANFVADTFINLQWYGMVDVENGIILAPGYEVLLWDSDFPLDNTKTNNKVDWKNQGWREINMSRYADDIIKINPTNIYKNKSNKWYFFNFNNSNKLNNNKENGDRMNYIWVRRLTSYTSIRDGDDRAGLYQNLNMADNAYYL